MLRNYFLINVLLLVVAGMLGQRFYMIWTKPLDIHTSGVTQPAKKDGKEADKKDIARKREAGLNDALYNVIVQKDLFRPSRSAPQVEDVPQQFFTNPPRLFGTVIMNNERSALLEDPNTKITRLYRQNDSFSGFTVSDIQESKVVLTRGDNSLEVKLREIKTITMPRPQPTPVQQPYQRPVPQPAPQPFQQVPQVQPQIQQPPPGIVQRPQGLPERPIRRRTFVPPPPAVAAPPQPVAPSLPEESQVLPDEHPQVEGEPEGDHGVIQ